MAESKMTADSLVLSDPTLARGVVYAAMSQPPADDERALGRLFFLLALESRFQKTDEIFHKLQTSVTDSYYRNREGTTELNFEKAVQDGNQTLRLFINERSHGLLDQFHAVIGVISGAEIYLTAAGRIHAFLSRGPRIMDILDSPSAAKPNPLRIFSHLIAGELQLGDRLLICTTSVLDYISIEKLRQTISGTTTAHASFTLESLLKDSSPTHAFGALVLGMSGVATATTVQRQPMTRPPIQPPVQASGQAPVMAQSSMASLQSRSRATSELLAPSVWLKVKALAVAGAARVTMLIRTKVFRRRPRRTVERPTDVISYRPSAATPGRLGGVAKTVRRLMLGVVGFIRAMGQSIGDVVRRRRTLRDSFSQLPSRTNESVNRTVRGYQRLSRSQQRLLVSAGILLLIFTGSIVWRGIGQEANLSEEQKAQLTTAIEQKIFQASAALSYGDDTGAITLLADAATLVDSYPHRAKVDREQQAAWQARIQTEREKTRHTTRLEAPTVFADLASAEITAGANDLVRLGSTLYTATNDKVIIIDSDGTVTTAAIPEHGGTVSQIATSGQNTVLILTTTGEMIEFTVGTERFTTVDVPFVNEDRQIADMTTYETRVYFLDTKNNQIFRHTRASLGISSGQAWIEDPEPNVTDIASLAVDGTIYTVSKGGTVTKWLQGNKVGDFVVNPIEPTLNQATAIFTNADMKLLYVLDPSEKRLILFTKTGVLKAQYVAAPFDSATGISVNQAETTAYLLSGTRIYSVPIE